MRKSSDNRRVRWISAVDGMAIVTAIGKYTYVNEGYARMLGNTSRDEMIGRVWENVSVGETQSVPDPDEIRAALKKDGRW